MPARVSYIRIRSTTLASTIRRGSIRDNFDFGAVVAVRVKSIGQLADSRWGGLYDLRLRISEGLPIVRIPEPLYAASQSDSRPSGQKQFDYVDTQTPGLSNRDGGHCCRSLEANWRMARFAFRAAACSDKAIPGSRERHDPRQESRANDPRRRDSALTQETGLEFNVIVVDNHSTDRTTGILNVAARILATCTSCPSGRTSASAVAGTRRSIRTYCGRYAVQLDSDDLYPDEQALRIELSANFNVGLMRWSSGPTDGRLSLREIPPGLIDHREWTRENGRNNALRINGLGAPRAFDALGLRGIGFPNASYGEDYSVALRISRHYEIGRIYDSIYLCRRWREYRQRASAVDFKSLRLFKDWVRTVEIEARIARTK